MAGKRLYRSRTVLLIALLAAGAPRVNAQQAPSLISFSITPGVTVPLGEDASLFSLGGVMNVDAEFRLPFLPAFFIAGTLGYSFVPLQEVTSLSLLDGGIAAGVRLDILRSLSIRAFGSGGYSYAFLNDGSRSGWSPSVSGGAGVSWAPFPSFTLGLASCYRAFLGLYNDVSISLQASYNVPPPKARPAESGAAQPPLPERPGEGPGDGTQESGRPESLGTETAAEKGEAAELAEVSFGNIFPVFHKYYDDHPLGRAVIRNNGATPLTNVVASFQIRQYMDAPKESRPIDRLEAGQSVAVDLFALFKDSILEITEATKASAEIAVTYVHAGQKASLTRIETVRILDRNSMTWEDDRRVAAFITARDSSVLTFARNVSGIMKDSGNREINQWLSMALATHEALSLYGLSYIVDPRRPYAELSQKKEEVDFLQFPRQTLEYKGGDCDDLSILYCALLEALGAETALVTVPGHIFMAVSLDMKPDEARQRSLRVDDLILREDRTWLPLEITQRRGGFLQAWQEGAKEWRENLARGQASLVPVHEAWALYEPVGLPGEGKLITLPAAEKIVASYTQEMGRFVDREIYAKAAKIQSDMQQTGETSALLNQLGVLYARYGLLDRAESQFQKAIRREEFLPALLNLGNISYLRNEREKALEFFDRASRKDPTNAKVVLNLARVNHEMENYGLVAKLYARLKSIDPDLALKYSYLDLKGEEASRAAEIGRVKGAVIWEE